MYHVVVGVGPDDEQTTEKVEAIADLPASPSSVRATVVHATDDPDAEPTDVGSVAEALDLFSAAGIETETVVVDDSPSDAVIQTVTAVDADCVCVGGRRRSPAGKLQLKSGSQRVILKSDVPVLVAGQAN